MLEKYVLNCVGKNLGNEKLISNVNVNYLQTKTFQFIYTIKAIELVKLRDPHGAVEIPHHTDTVAEIEIEAAADAQVEHQRTAPHKHRHRQHHGANRMHRLRHRVASQISPSRPSR